MRNWLQKHRWVNELLKTIAATMVAYFGYIIWQGAELAAAEMRVEVAFKPMMVFGISVGIMGMLAMFILIDVVCSVVGIIKTKRASRGV